MMIISRILLFPSLVSLVAAFLSVEVYAQKSDSNQVVCYLSQLKNPQGFLGMSGDSFELFDGSSWRVTSSAYTYIPNSSGGVLVCPELKKMFASNAAITIEKSAKRGW